MSVTRVRGIVKFYDSRDGYGYIQCQAMPDVFVHRTAVICNVSRDLCEGECVEFTIVESERGPQAHAVTRVDDFSPDAP